MYPILLLLLKGFLLASGGCFSVSLPHLQPTSNTFYGTHTHITNYCDFKWSEWQSRKCRRVEYLKPLSFPIAEPTEKCGVRNWRLYCLNRCLPRIWQRRKKRHSNPQGQQMNDVQREPMTFNHNGTCHPLSRRSA